VAVSARVRSARYSPAVIVHLNGQLVRAEEARISPFDRGFTFGDGVYEGLRAVGGVVAGLSAHVERMRAGLAECRIDGFDPGDLGELSAPLLETNGLRDAFLYWQVTRGCPLMRGAGTAELRARAPKRGALSPTVFGIATSLPPIAEYRTPRTKSAAIRPDTRWLRGHVKSISLMGGVLAAYEALEEGAEEPILERDGFVTEGVATNVLVCAGGRVATPPVSGGLILGGVTRRILLEAVPSIEVRPVSVAELERADEIMLVGTATMVASVTMLDGRPVGSGAPGPVATKLLRDLVGALDRDTSPSSLRV
jgi:D-alanine transaminase